MTIWWLPAVCYSQMLDGAEQNSEGRNSDLFEIALSIQRYHRAWLYGRIARRTVNETIAWNCNMAFHKKYTQLLALRPDIAIIPECASPELLALRAPEFAPSSSIWIGRNRHKGLGVFTFGAFHGELSPIYENDIPFIAPVRIQGPTSFSLLGVWACHNSPQYRAKHDPLKRALAAYRAFIK